MTFEDKPEPGMDYLAFLVLSTALTLATSIWHAADKDPSGWEFHLVFLFSMGTFLVVLIRAFHAAYHTSYRLDGEVLTLRRGGSEKKVVLDKIKSIDQVGFDLNTLSLGFGSKDFSNRLTDKVKLTTDDGKFYISPTNPQLFVSHVRGMRYHVQEDSASGIIADETVKAGTVPAKKLNDIVPD
ncbi:MAG: hypothetical protein FVQ81_08695 [Candidatus Glassbacteria bacterium]|nr:hypothetical protein [Candidatus Glassbacteria bacterium]